LLALGNGAADVSATMSAIVSDEENGYKLSLGALTGAAMLVGGLVAGVVVLVAGGVPCRGALVRDVAALLITVAVVWTHLKSGEIGPGSTTLFLSLYGVFVCLVLVADVYHRTAVLPRLAALEDEQEITRQLSDERRINAAVAGEEGADPSTASSMSVGSSISQSPSIISKVITAMSNYDNTPRNNNNGQAGPTSDGWGIDSDRLEQDRPIILHGQHGILHGDGQTPVMSSEDNAGMYSLVEENVDRLCVQGGTLGFSASNWSGAWHDGKQDLVTHANEVWRDIFYNADVSIVTKIVLVCELPFTVIRKVCICRIVRVKTA
jgi:sodium/potassium/calcium exchanger 6